MIGNALGCGANGPQSTPMTRQQRNPIEDSLEPDDLFHSIRSKLAQRNEASEPQAITVDVFPIAADPIPRLDTPLPRESARTDLGVGDVLRGRYVIESQLASGGMGTVY